MPHPIRCALAALLLPLLAAPVSAQAATALPTPATFLYGWNVHLASTYQYGTLPALADRLIASGANSYRDAEEWAWTDYGPTAGTFRYGADLNAAVAQISGRLQPAGLMGLQILGFENNLYWQQATQDITVNPAAAGSVFQTYAKGFRTYAQQQLARRPGQGLYQIGNEWNGGFHLNSAMPNYTLARDGDTYARLYLSVAADLRTRAPQARLLTAGLADCAASATLPYGMCWPWLIDQLAHVQRLGGNLQLIDGLGLHPYADYDPLAIPERLYSGLVTGRNWLMTQSPAYAAAPKDFYLTETGIPNTTSSGKAISESLQADYLQRMALLYRTLPYVKGVWFYEFANRPLTGREGSFGVVTAALVDKPAFAPMKALAPLVIRGTNWKLVSGDVKVTDWAKRLTDQWILYRPTKLYTVECDYLDPADGKSKRITAFWAPQGTLPVTVQTAGTTVAHRTAFAGTSTTRSGNFALTATSSPQFLIRPAGVGTVLLK
jgi:hypothetical protein